eukprot:920572-Prymnesium_polylepis.1
MGMVCEVRWPPAARWRRYGVASGAALAGGRAHACARGARRTEFAHRSQVEELERLVAAAAEEEVAARVPAQRVDGALVQVQRAHLARRLRVPQPDDVVFGARRDHRLLRVPLRALHVPRVALAAVDLRAGEEALHRAAGKVPHLDRRVVRARHELG